MCYIGTFDTPEQASAAYVSVRKDLDDAKVSSCGANEGEAIFDAVRKKAIEAMGGAVPKKRNLPRGVYKSPPEKFQSSIWWGGMQRYIGTFDTPEQAYAAYISVKKNLNKTKLSEIDADEADAIFTAVKKKAMEMVQANEETIQQMKASGDEFLV